MTTGSTAELDRPMRRSETGVTFRSHAERTGARAGFRSLAVGIRGSTPSPSDWADHHSSSGGTHSRIHLFGPDLKYERVQALTGGKSIRGVCLVSGIGSLTLEDDPLTNTSFITGIDTAWCSARGADFEMAGILYPAAAPSGQVLSQWQPVLSDLDRWQTLPFDWDGDDGRPASASAARAARLFIGMLQRNGLGVPEHYIAGDGEVSFDWRDGTAVASLSFLEDGSLAGYFQAARGEPLLELEAADIERADLSVFLHALRRFA